MQKYKNVVNINVHLVGILCKCSMYKNARNGKIYVSVAVSASVFRKDAPSLLDSLDTC